MKDQSSIRIPYKEMDITVNAARLGVYALISTVTAVPDKRHTREMDHPESHSILNSAIEMISNDQRFHPPSLGPGEINPAELKLTLPAQLGSCIEAEYEPVFGYCASKDCSPYEAEYYPQKEVNFRTQQMADVAGFYRAFGLSVSRQAHERVDHVSLETEFMSIVISRELHAVQKNLGQDIVDLCRDVQRKFFKDHLGWWLPAFGANLLKQASGFYMVLGKLICGFVPAERAILGLPSFDQLPAAASIPYQEMTCDGK